MQRGRNQRHRGLLAVGFHLWEPLEKAKLELWKTDRCCQGSGVGGEWPRRVMSELSGQWEMSCILIVELVT